MEAMSLYRYVSGREDLLEAVIAELLADIRPNMDELLARTWQGYLQSLAHAVRQIAIEHPGAFPLVATRHPAAPWLRPPLRSLELVEDFLSTLSDFGFNDDQVVSTYRSFTSFLLGHLLLESSVRGAQTSAVDEPLDEGGATVSNQDGRVDSSGSPSHHQVPRQAQRGSQRRGVRNLAGDIARPPRDGRVAVASRRQPPSRFDFRAARRALKITASRDQAPALLGLLDLPVGGAGQVSRRRSRSR